MLPLISPETHPKYFGAPQKRLSGIISQIIAYKKASVMHQQLRDIYGPYMDSNHQQLVLSYENDTDFAVGLEKLLKVFREDKKKPRVFSHQFRTKSWYWPY
jgi:hypothetical protein